MFKNNRGFTLIEMLVVLMIISALIILIVPNISKKSEDIYSKGCQALISVVQAQVDAYYLEEGSYPSSLDELENAGYITKDQKTCTDKTPLSYANGVIKATNE